MNFIRNTFGLIFLAFNGVIGIAFLAAAYAQYVSPEQHPILSLAGLGFPFFAVANLLFFFFWLIVHPRYAFLPVGIFLLGIDALLTYCPMGKTSESSGRDVVKVLTYNTMGMPSKQIGKGRKVIPAVEFIKESKADIVCLQEFPVLHKEIVRQLKPVYPYMKTISLKSDSEIACFSKTPILSAKRIDLVSRGNGAGLFYVKKGDKKIPVIAVHLESNKLNGSDKEIYESILESPKHRLTKRDSKRLLSKLADAASLRGPQADLIAAKIRAIDSPYTIVCGDFNDIALSYTRRVIASTLQDTYRKAAFGPGATYHAHFMYFRIDHILAGQGYRVLKCKIEKGEDSSDHYPYWCQLEL